MALLHYLTGHYLGDFTQCLQVRVVWAEPVPGLDGLLQSVGAHERTHYAGVVLN